MTTIPVKTKFLLLGLAAGGVSSDFGVVPIFFSLAHAQAGTFAIRIMKIPYLSKRPYQASATRKNLECSKIVSRPELDEHDWFEVFSELILLEVVP